MAWTGDKSNPVPNIGNVKGDLSQEIAQQSSNLSEKKTDVNRAYQTRRDTDNQKDNTVSILDIDTAIMKQLEKFQMTVTDEGNQIKVPFYFASPEKWKAIKKDGYIRDNNGKIIFPLLVYNRISTEADKSTQVFNKYLRYDVIKKYSQKNKKIALLKNV